MKRKGKLIRAYFHQMMRNEGCYRCGYLFGNHGTPATQTLVKLYEHARHEVYFCEKCAETVEMDKVR